MISPFAPLYPWLVAACEGSAWTSTVTYPHAVEPTAACSIDLRHGPTRYAVLRALAEAGHDRPWALGAPWSALTDEQAGRVTAEIVRAVGADPGAPVGVVPVCVVEAWSNGSPARRRRYAGIRGPLPELFSAGWYVSLPNDISSALWERGPETGEPGRLAADNAARALGCIMIEDITP